MRNHTPTFTVTFICSGNICRSPMAEIVTAELIRTTYRSELITVDSAGLGDWHVGEPADPRAIQALAERGFSGESHIARVFNPIELTATNLIIALDNGHYDALHALQKEVVGTAQIELLRSFDAAAEAPLGVPDPYYGDQTDFDLVLEQIMSAAKGLVSHLHAEADVFAAQQNTAVENSPLNY